MNKIWQDEPAWLQKKRQLAVTLMPRLPQTADQDQWIASWGKVDKSNGEECEDWLEVVNDDLIALPLVKAVNDYPDLLQENLMEKGVCWQDSQLNASHLARIDCGQFIYVPTGKKIIKPVQLSPEISSANPHNLIIVGSNANLTIEEKMTNSSTTPVYAATEVLVGANATVHFRQASQYLTPLALQAIHVYQAHGSTFNLELAGISSNNLQTDLYSFLDGNDTHWQATVGLQTTENGQQLLTPVVDGFGKQTTAELSLLTHGAVKRTPLKTGSGEPLSITSKQLNEQNAPSWLINNLSL